MIRPCAIRSYCELPPRKLSMLLIDMARVKSTMTRLPSRQATTSRFENQEERVDHLAETAIFETARAPPNDHVMTPRSRTRSYVNVWSGRNTGCRGRVGLQQATEGHPVVTLWRQEHWVRFHRSLPESRYWGEVEYRQMRTTRPMRKTGI